MTFDSKTYYQANKEKILSRVKVYSDANKDKINARMKVYYETNKERIKARERVYRAANKDKIAAHRKSYMQTEMGKAKRARYNARHPERVRARNSLRYAIDRGDLIRQPCEVCSTTNNIHAHHDDYDKPFDVRWLCKKHHQEHHNKMRGVDEI